MYACAQMPQHIFMRATHVVGFVAATNEAFMKCLCNRIQEHPTLQVCPVLVALGAPYHCHTCTHVMLWL